jgi:hypothetical protein
MTTKSSAPSKAVPSVKAQEKPKKVRSSKPSTNPFVEQHPGRMGRAGTSGSKGSHRGGR